MTTLAPLSTIYNARDLALQATVPRLTVTAATIDPTATTFAKPRNVSTITPGSIDLTTLKVGFTNPAYTWSYRPSNSQVFTTIAGATSNSYNITSNTFLSHKGLNATSVEYKLTISQPGWETASTTVTINYTSAANDVPVATLNKTSIILPTSEFGVINYANTNSVITVSIGGTNIPYAALGPNTFNIETSVFPLNSVDIGTQTANTFGTLNNLTAELATITYTVKARDADGVETTIPLTQNVAKAVSGGTALVYKLISPAIVLRNQDNTSFTPTKITFGSKVGTGSLPPVNYGGRFVIQTSTDNVNYTTRYTSSANESSYEYTLSDHGGVYVTSIKVSLYLASGTATLIDSEVIPVNREGQFALNLTNDNHTISTNAAGAVVSGLPVSSEAEIFFGLTKQTTGWTFAWTASAGITMAPGTAATSTVTVTAATTNGTVTVVATKTDTGETKTAVFSISRAIGGTNSYRVDLSNNNQTMRINADGDVTSPWPTTAITVYNGSAIDTGWSFSPLYSNPLIVGTFNTAVTPNTFTLSAFPAAAGLDGYVDIVATQTDKAPLTARLTLTKTANAVIYEITASTDAVSKDISGISTPNSLTFTAYRIDGNNVRTVYNDGVITLQSATAGGAFTALAATSTGASTASYTIPTNTNFVSIKGILKKDAVIVDDETVPIVSDGPKGVNSYRIDLSNNNQTLKINAAGTVTSPNPTTLVAVYNGTALDAGWTLTPVFSLITGLTGTFDGSVATILSSNTVERVFTLTSYTNAALDAYVDIVATKSGYATLTARLTLTKTSNAVTYELIPSARTIAKNISGVSTPNSITFTAYQIDGNNTATVYTGGTITLQSATAGSAFSALTPSSTTTSSASYTIPNNTTFVNIKGILTVGGVAVDNETVAIVSDGPKGADSTVEGPPGDAAVTAYKIVTGTSLPSAPSAPTGAPVSGNATGTTNWYTLPATSLASNQWLFQATGTVSAGVYTWNATTFLATFKVGALSALTTETGTLTIGTGGYIRGGKTAYGDATNAGFFLGTDSSVYKFKIGSGASTLSWDGSTLSVPAISITGTITGSQIATGAIGTTNFASNIEPVSVVSGSVVPTVKSTYSIFLTGTGKLYRWNGSAYVASVPTDDITGTISSVQIATSAINADKIAAGAVEAAKIANNAVNTANLVLGAVTAEKVGSNAITAGKIATGAVTAGTVAANAITAGTIATGAVTAGTVAANAITAGTIATGAVTAGTITTNAVTAGTVATNAITAGTIATGAVTAGTIATNAVTAGTIAAGAVTADQLSATAITGKTITGGTIIGSVIRTAGVGSQRIAINEASNRLSFFNTAGAETIVIGGNGEIISVTSGSTVTATILGASTGTSLNGLFNPGVLGSASGNGHGVIGKATSGYGGYFFNDTDATKALYVSGNATITGTMTSPNHNYNSTSSTSFYSNQIAFANAGVVKLSVEATNLVSYSTFVTNINDSQYLGNATWRWKSVYLMTAPDVLSDERVKTNIQSSVLGLNFINQLRPVSYQLISGGMEQTGEFTEEYVEEVGITKKVPIYRNVPGVRKHYGLIAQEVKSTLDLLNLGDFAGFVLEDKNDPNSQHSLRYEEFISPLIKAVQELSAKVTALENRLNS